METIRSLQRVSAQSCSNIIVGLTRLFSGPMQANKHAALRENLIKTVSNLAEYQLELEPDCLSIAHTLSCLSTLGLHRPDIFQELAAQLPNLAESPGEREIAEIFIACAAQGWSDPKFFQYLLSLLAKKEDVSAQTLAEATWSLAACGRHREPKLQKLAPTAKLMRRTFQAALDKPTDFSVEDGCMLLQTEIALRNHTDLPEKYPRLAAPMYEMFVHGHTKPIKKPPKQRAAFADAAKSIGLKVAPQFKTKEGLFVDLACKAADGSNIAVQFLDRECFYLNTDGIKGTVQFQLELLRGLGWKVATVKSFEMDNLEGFKQDMRTFMADST